MGDTPAEGRGTVPRPLPLRTIKNLWAVRGHPDRRLGREGPSEGRDPGPVEGVVINDHVWPKQVAGEDRRTWTSLPRHGTSYGPLRRSPEPPPLSQRTRGTQTVGTQVKVS